MKTIKLVELLKEFKPKFKLGYYIVYKNNSNNTFKDIIDDEVRKLIKKVL